MKEIFLVVETGKVEEPFAPSPECIGWGFLPVRAKLSIYVHVEFFKQMRVFGKLSFIIQVESIREVTYSTVSGMFHRH